MAVIKSFACKETKALFYRERIRKIPPDIQRAALRKLKIIDAALDLEDLRIPPGNQLEKLKGNRQGQYSIRINDQWRICFNFERGEATGIEIIDYH